MGTGNICNVTAARSAFEELTEKWGQRYPAVIRLRDNAWNEFIPFLDYRACRRIARQKFSAHASVCVA